MPALFASLMLLALIGPGGAQAQVLENGQRYTETIAVGAPQDSYTLPAAVGDNVVRRMGTVGFNPRIDLYSPGGTLVKSGFIGSTGGRDAELSFQITNAGNHTVTVSSYYANGVGSYTLSVARVPSAVQVSVGDDGGPMTNGVQHAGTIDVGDLDVWNFSATTGDSIVVRMGATSLNPHIRLYSPTGVLLDTGFVTATGGRDTELSFRATNSGVFTVVANSYYANFASPYILTLVKAPGAVVISPADDGGPMTNGVQHTGNIDVGDIDPWTFSANTGDSIVVRMGTTTFNPHIRLYSPLGVLLDTGFTTATGGRDAELSFRATNSGVFTVVANSYYGNGTGPYILTLAKAPGAIVVAAGDDGGPMTNGVKHTGVIDVGDLDVWDFSAAAGDSIVVRMGTEGFNPHLRLYSPLGVLLDTAFVTATGSRETEVAFRATNSGTYTIVANSYYGNGTSPYILTLVKAPGAFLVSANDQGGPMTNAVQHTGVIDVGDLDAWDFTAATGESIVIRLGTTGFNPYIRLYSPLGVLLDAGFTSATGGRDGELSIRATNSGTYTLVASSYYANGTGSYLLTLAKTFGGVVVTPGDQGGPLINGFTHAATLDVGDLDVWTFAANSGDNFILRLGTTGYNPHIRVFGPDGVAAVSSFASATGARDVEISALVTNSGLYTVVANSYYGNGTGDYILTLVHTPGTFTVAPGDTGGALTNAAAYEGALETGDLDVWTFLACRATTVTVQAEKLSGTGSFGPRLRLYGKNGTLLANAQHATSALLTYKTTNTGPFTLVLGSGTANQNGTYRITGTGIVDDQLSLCSPLVVGTNLNLSGLGGTPQATFVIYTSTEVTTPLAQWTPYVTNHFDSLGLFDLLSTFNKTEPKRFFRLLEQ